MDYYVNFTASTGVLLNTSHDNALLPFMHYIYCTTNDNSIDIQLDFSLVNGSFYKVTIATTSNIYVRYHPPHPGTPASADSSSTKQPSKTWATTTSTTASSPPPTPTQPSS